MLFHNYFPKCHAKHIKKIIKEINKSLDDFDSPFFDSPPMTSKELTTNLIKVSMKSNAKDDRDPQYIIDDERFIYNTAYIEGYIRGVNSVEKK